MNPISKAIRGLVSKASTGTLSEYMIGSPAQYGQPNITQAGDAYGLITAPRMREIVLKTPTAAACVNAILDYATGVPIRVRNIDPAQKPPARATAFINDLMRQPNPQENGRRFQRKVLRDMVVLGHGAVEIEPGMSGAPVANLWALDAGRLKIDYDEHGLIRGYDMLDARGIPIIGSDGKHAWTPDELIYFNLDPKSESEYPTSRVVQLFALGVIESMILSFIGARFTDANVPFGFLDLGDLNETELEAAILIWNNQLAQEGEHRILMTASRGASGAKFQPFGYKLSDLEAPTLLADIRSKIMAILGVTVNELGEAEDVNKSNGFNLSYTFKKRAIEPVLDEFTETVTTRLLWATLSYKQAEMYYEEIDSRDELLQGQIDDIYWKSGVISTNDIRNRKGMPSIKGGEEPCVFTGSAYVPVSMVNAFAKAQLDALEAINKQTLLSVEQIQQQMDQAAANPMGASGTPPTVVPGITEPMIRSMEPPERYTTIDGRGSSTPKIKLAKPSAKLQPTPKSSASTAPRGPVESAQRAGIRKDQQ